VPGHPGNHTYCYKCGETVIERVYFFVKKLNVKDGKCGACGAPIAGVWE
jgi:pyruvate formate lyase activating enzyme